MRNEAREGINRQNGMVVSSGTTIRRGRGRERTEKKIHHRHLCDAFFFAHLHVTIHDGKHV